MTYAIPCSGCGEFAPPRTHRPAVVHCPRCGGAAELLDADTTRDTNAVLGAPQPLSKYVATDGAIVKAQPNGDDARCSAPACGRAKRTCGHVAEVVATLRAGE